MSLAANKKLTLALIGYGKMGKAIEEIALAKGHTIILRISIENIADFTEDALSGADVAIEFTGPESAAENIKKCLEAGVPVVSGSTGWLQEWNAVETVCAANGGTLLYASNFSVGVNLFFELNNYLARLMRNYPGYNVRMEEIHHTQKKDAPSGTAITLAEQVIAGLDNKTRWVLNDLTQADAVPIVAHRMEHVPGTHTITYSSPIDNIDITHTAHNRDGFAIGAVLAAEYIAGKQGIFSMKDVLFGGK